LSNTVNVCYHRAANVSPASTINRDNIGKHWTLFASRLIKRHGFDRTACVESQHKRYQPEIIELELEHHDSVEIAVAEFYDLQEDADSCYYVENNLFNGVLGLVIWEVMFAPLPGAFYNPFQYRPADFYEHDFCARRIDLLTQTWESINSNEDIWRVVSARWQQKQGLMNPLVNWQYLDLDLIELALERIDYRHWRQGAGRQFAKQPAALDAIFSRTRNPALPGPGDMADELKIGIRELVEFCCRDGDLGFDGGPGVKALDGMQTHQKIQRRYQADAESEVSVKLVTSKQSIRRLQAIKMMRCTGHSSNATVPAMHVNMSLTKSTSASIWLPCFRSGNSVTPKFSRALNSTLLLIIPLSITCVGINWWQRNEKSRVNRHRHSSFHLPIFVTSSADLPPRSIAQFRTNSA
jgi:hypothetical protein